MTTPPIASSWVSATAGLRSTAPRVFCAQLGIGLGVALKAEDGAWRPLRSALAAFLARLGLEAGDLANVPVENSRGEVVGEAPRTLTELIPIALFHNCPFRTSIRALGGGAGAAGGPAQCV